MSNTTNGARRKHRTACYPSLREHREELGWSVQELIAKLDGASVSERSVRRLEGGFGIRPANVNKIFNAVSKNHPSDLNRKDHIKLVGAE